MLSWSDSICRKYLFRGDTKLGSTISVTLTAGAVAVNVVNIVAVVVVDGVGGFSKSTLTLVPVSSLTPHLTPNNNTHFSNLSFLSSLVLPIHSYLILLLGKDTWWEFWHTLSPCGGSPAARQTKGFLVRRRTLFLASNDPTDGRK